MKSLGCDKLKCRHLAAQNAFGKKKEPRYLNLARLYLAETI
uniref:Uncharacterized protein n=1 Tax=Manihot esculenta TaxID=3983 RepID=A0A2C9UKM2_MANES